MSRIEKLHYKLLYLKYELFVIFLTNRDNNIALVLEVGDDLCLKYYRDPRHRVRCVMIVIVELRCTDCTNKWSPLFETTYFYKDVNGGYNCVLIVRVQKCEYTIQNLDTETFKRTTE